MKLLLLLFTAFTVMSCTHRQVITSKNVINSGVVRLYSPTGGHGTGFYISNTWILSAKHVCTIPWFQASDQSKVDEVIIDDYSDLCLIKTSGHSVPHRHFNVSYEKLAVGDFTCNAGFGQYGYTYNCGNIKGMLRFYRMGMLNWLYLSDQFAIPGMSGGPVFKGKYVVGVTVIQHRGELGFVSNQQVKRFIEAVKRARK